MFGIGTTELMVILVVALIVVGPKKLPQIARTMGKAFGEFRRVSTDLHRTINTEIEREERTQREKEEKKKLAQEAKDKEEAEQKKSAEEEQAEKTYDSAVSANQQPFKDTVATSTSSDKEDPAIDVEPVNNYDEQAMAEVEETPSTAAKSPEVASKQDSAVAAEDKTQAKPQGDKA